MLLWVVSCEKIGARGADPSLSPCVSTQNAPGVYVQNVSVCTGTTPASGTTCGLGAGTHGKVVNGTHGREEGGASSFFIGKTSDLFF